MGFTEAELKDIDKSLKPLSRFLHIYIIKLENIEFLKTPKSELIGFIILISLFLSMKKSFIFIYKKIIYFYQWKK